VLQRVRLGFLLLGALLAIPLCLLSVHTFRGLAKEREARHRAVASRVFDEAERALGDFLEQEERRAPMDYLAALAGGPSALSGMPEWSFVRGYFATGASGEVRALGSSTSPPPWEKAEALFSSSPALRQARTEEDFAAEADSTSPSPTSLAPTEQALRPQSLGVSPPESPATSPTPSSAPPVYLRRVAPKIQERALEAPPADTNALAEAKRKSEAESRDLSADSAPLDSYEVLEQLNLASSRQRKQSKLELGASEVLAPARQRTDVPRAAQELADSKSGEDERTVPSATAEEAAIAAQDASDRSEAVAGSADDSTGAEREAAGGREFLPLRANILRREDTDTSEAARYWATPGRAPFEVLRLDDDLILLYRYLEDPERGRVRMGFMLDLGLLGAWVDRQVVQESGLGDYLTLTFVADADALAPVLASQEFARSYAFTHRFEAPFDQLHAALAVTPLPEGAATYSIYAMAVMLVLVATAGLFAMYQRVATVIHFSERRSNFAASVSHELKTPLTSIRMYAEMLRDGMIPDAERRQEYLGVITAESERLTRLIQNVLEFSKLERRVERASLEVQSPEPAIRGAIKAIEPHARAMGFEIRLALEEPLPRVELDLDALEQILFNLIDNAIKYAASREPRSIELSARADDDFAFVCVRDHGPGVPAEQLQRIFEPFYRGEHELTRTTRGTGIGLALVRSLCERIRAQVTATNHPEGGLEVCVRLRRAVGPEAEA